MWYYFAFVIYNAQFVIPPNQIVYTKNKIIYFTADSNYAWSVFFVKQDDIVNGIPFRREHQQNLYMDFQHLSLLLFWNFTDQVQRFKIGVNGMYVILLLHYVYLILLYILFTKHPPKNPLSNRNRFIYQWMFGIYDVECNSI